MFTHLYIQEDQQIPSRKNTTITTPKHSTVKMLKDKEKEKNLKASKEKRTYQYKGGHNKINSWHLILTLDFQVQKALGWHTETAERWILSTKNPISSKGNFKNEGKLRYSQINKKVENWYQTCLQEILQKSFRLKGCD